MLVGSFPREPVFTIIATVGIVFAALYVLWVYQQMMPGPVRGNAVLAALGSVTRGRARRHDRSGDRGATGRLGLPRPAVREIAVLTPLIVAILVLGFFPGPVLDVIEPVGRGDDGRGRR